MGSNTSQNKASTSTNSTGTPSWATPGSAQYQAMNSQLATAPMAAANATIANAGQGGATQGAIDKLSNSNPTGTGAANDYLTSYARGDYLQGNPYLDDIIAKNSQDMANQTNQLFASGGRYGSGVHQGTLADSIGGMTSNLRYNDFNTQQQNQLNAANALESSQQGRLGLQSQNLMNAAGLENQGFQNVLGMISQLPTIQNNKVFDANQQMNVGNQVDSWSQQQLDDLINQWTQTDMQDWARLGGLMSVGTGTAGNWGTSSTTQKQPMNILGGLAAILGAL